MFLKNISKIIVWSASLIYISSHFYNKYKEYKTTYEKNKIIQRAENNGKNLETALVSNE